MFPQARCCARCGGANGRGLCAQQAVGLQERVVLDDEGGTIVATTSGEYATIQEYIWVQAWRDTRAILGLPMDMLHDRPTSELLPPPPVLES